MKTLKQLMAFMLLGLIIMTYSCSKKDDGPVGCNYANEVLDELQTLSDAANAYGMDPTTAKCQAYVNAYQAYLNALEDHLSCATIYGNQAELQAAINQAQADLDNIQC